MTRIDTVSVELRAVTQGFVNGMRDAGNLVSRQSASIFGNIGKVTQGFFFAKEAVGALAGGATQLYGFGQAIFDMGADAEETASKFSATLGPAADRVQREIERVANIMGLTSTEARDLISTTAGVALGMGQSQEAAADFALSVQQVAGDITSYKNIPIKQTTEAVTKAMLGQREMLDSLGIIIRENDVATMALTQTGKENAKELTNQEKATATLALIQERAGYMMGNLEMTQNSSANTARRLGAQFREMREILARALVPAISQVMGAIADLIGSSGMEGIIDAVVAARDQIAAWALVGVEAFKTIALSIYATVENAVNLVLALGDVGAAIAHLLTFNFDGLKQEVADIRNRFAEVKENVEGQVGSFGTLKDAVVTAMQTGKAEVDVFKRGMNEADKQIIDATGSVDEQAAAIAKIGERLDDMFKKYGITEKTIRESPLEIVFLPQSTPERIGQRITSLANVHAAERQRIRDQALQILVDNNASPETIANRITAMGTIYGRTRQDIRDQRIIMSEDPNTGPGQLLRTIELLAPGVQRAADEIKQKDAVARALTSSIEAAQRLGDQFSQLERIVGPVFDVIASHFPGLRGAINLVLDGLDLFIQQLRAGVPAVQALENAAKGLEVGGLVFLLDATMGMILSMFAGRSAARAEAERLHKALLDNRQALQANTDAQVRSLTGGFGGETLANIMNVLAAVTRAREQFEANLPPDATSASFPFMQILMEQLAAVGLSMADLQAVASALNVDFETSSTFIEMLGARIEALINNQLSGFAAQMDNLRDVLRLRGVDVREQLRQTINMLMGQVGPALDVFLESLFTAKPDEAGNILANMVEGLRAGNRNLIASLGQIPIDDFVDVLLDLFQMFGQLEDSIIPETIRTDNMVALTDMFDPILMDVGEAAVDDAETTMLMMEQDRIAYDGMINRLDALDARLNTLISTNRTGFEDVTTAVRR